MATMSRKTQEPLRYPQQVQVRPDSERAAFGLSLRQRCPRKAHARWRSAPKRGDPVALLIATDKGRMPNLIRHA